MSDFSYDDELDGGIAAKKKRRVKKPRRYKVLLHNDDYTTTEFVVEILMDFFHKSHAEATFIMLQVHHQGVGVAGVYSKEVAETKVAEVTAVARKEGMPLLLTTEAE
jgi:ATP-dependent Clp protease adaptor protein ClpS